MRSITLLIGRIQESTLGGLLDSTPLTTSGFETFGKEQRRVASISFLVDRFDLRLRQSETGKKVLKGGDPLLPVTRFRVI